MARPKRQITTAIWSEEERHQALFLLRKEREHGEPLLAPFVHGFIT
jgi:hypothetical protein